jgi:hypothetical protein
VDQVPHPGDVALHRHARCAEEDELAVWGCRVQRLSDHLRVTYGVNRDAGESAAGELFDSLLDRAGFTTERVGRIF